MRKFAIPGGCLCVWLLIIPASTGTEDLQLASGVRTWSLAGKMYSDKKARQIGDLLTVIIEEQSEVTKDAKSTSSKDSSLGGSASLGHPTVDTRPTAWTNSAIPSYTMSAKQAFSGAGAMANKDKLTSTMTVRILEVLPNGSFIIEGKRSVAVQDETVEVMLTGTVRQNDIARDNTVKSSQIGDLMIKYFSKGPIADNTKRGLLTRVWEWIAPF